MATLIIRPRSRIFHGHEWVYGTEILKTTGDPKDGDTVGLVEGKRGKFIGSAIFNGQSQIVARRFSRQKQALDADFFLRRVQQASELRDKLAPAINPRVCRVVWSESDGLPGVIVDRYEDVLVLQTLTMAMDQRLDLIVEALKEVYQPRVIVERNDSPIRRAEGMDLRTGLLHGQMKEGELTQISLNGLTFELDLAGGQKTGFYLDQVANYAAVARHAKGRRVLDCFTNQGAFALFCKQAGSERTVGVESSGPCLELAAGNASRNSLEVEWVEENVFDYLKSAERSAAAGGGGSAPWDMVILDPPSFTRSKKRMNDAARGYKEIHLRAMKLLQPGGLLATFSCSHHMDDASLRDIIHDAAVDARCTLRIVERLGQSPDHPVLLNLPESEYLRGYIFELMPGR